MIQPWREILRETAFENPFQEIQRVRYEIPDRGEHDFFIQHSKSYAEVFALTADRQVILATEFRPGPGCILSGLPGGLVEHGEDVAAAAERELLEETGYRAAQFVPLFSRPVAAYVTGIKHAFLALDCEQVAEQSLDPTEDIQVDLCSIDELHQLMAVGEFIDIDVALMGLRKLAELEKQT